MPDYRNPNRDELIAIAKVHAELMRAFVDYGKFALGGSVVSDTAVIGYNDVDIRLLAPEGRDSCSELRKISASIESVVPFCKECKKSPISGEEIFYILNKKKLARPIGEVTVDVSVMSEAQYVPLGLLMLQLPKEELDLYVKKKYLALKRGEKRTYKRIKKNMYSRLRRGVAEGRLERPEPFWL
jgi:hypothetical protein